MIIEKSKSSHHQNENTFRFQTFHERLANVNIDVARKLGKFSSTPEDADTFFGEALDKWSDLNCTKHFVDFRKEITADVQTFVQLVHHQKDVVVALQKHLRVENSMAIQPLLDLVVQLARDLQADFYPYFQQFFGCLVWLLDVRHHDVEVLEQTFTCLAYVFKFLWRLMLKDVYNVYGLFCPLLGAEYKDYINIFASECFSFLMRKVKDKSELIDFMFQRLTENTDQAQGVGTLLFEMTKGVKNQFHSITEQVLPVILSKLGVDKLPQSQVEVSLKQTFTLMATHTNQEHSSVLWSALLKHAVTVHKNLEEKHSSTHENSFVVTLSLVGILVKHKNGGLVGKGNHLVEVLCTLLQGSYLSESAVQSVLGVVAELLMADRATLEPQHRPRLITTVYHSAFGRELIFQFTRQVFDLPLFEKDLLPALLTYCSTQCTISPDDITSPEVGNPQPYRDILELLVSLCIHKVPPWKGVMESQHLKPYQLDFTAGHRSKNKDKELSNQFALWVCRTLDRLTESISTEDKLRDVWLCVYIVSRIKPIQTTDCVRLLKNVIVQLQKEILGKTQEVNSDLLETVLTEAVLSLFELMEEKEFVMSLSGVLEVKQVLSGNTGSVSILRLSDLYYSSLRSVNQSHTELAEEGFTEVYTHIQTNLSSPHHQVRLLSLHICCQFDLPLPTLSEDKQDVPQPGVFTICLSAEEIKPDVNTYRDILMHLRKLDYELVQSQLPLGEYSQVPLRYLLGMLYSNLVLLWAPITELIQSHASGLDIDTFWQVYRQCLEDTASLTEKQLQCDTRTRSFNSSVMDTSSVSFNTELVTLEDYVKDWDYLTERVNWDSYRQLLWKAMAKFPATCEARTRILSPLLFRFLENEYNPEDLTAAQYQDIRRAELKSSDTSVDDGDITEHLEDSTMDVEETNRLQPKEEESVQTKRKRASNRTLVLHLQVFSLFRDPRSCYLEPRLRELYFNLLQHKGLEVQKVAFSCLLTYKHKYLTPYKENFERLLDDKHFKKEIVLFSIDQEATTIQPEHRPDLMPILMRIMYGKMQTKTGKDTSGKNQSQVRKNLVLRFLAGSTQDELSVFFDLVFQPFLHLCQGNLKEEVSRGLSDLDMAQVISLRKQQGMLDTMEIIIKKLGHLIEGYLPRLLSILLCLAAQYVNLLDHREQMAAKHIHFVKNLRQIVHARIIQFFSAFENYAFSRMEIDALFDAVVWPHLEKLEYEGTYSTTGLLSLLAACTNTSRFFPLLAKTHPKAQTLSPLLHVFSLLQAKQVDKSVVAMVMEMTENLLTMEDFEATENCALVDVGSTVQLSAEGPALTLGTQLVIPHVSSILDHLKTVVIKLSSEKNKKKAVPLTELTILSRLSEYVTDQDQSSAIVELLLPFLSRHVSASIETEVHILTALTHLIGKVHKPQIFWSDIAKLFTTLSSRKSRALLCDLVTTVEAEDPAVNNVSTLITNLNAWDPKRVEEPDYMIRLDAYNECVRIIQKTPREELSTVFCQLLLHNCVYFLATTDDMSLRDSSSHCLQQLIDKLAHNGEGEDTDSHKSELFTVLIRDNLLPEIKDKLKLKMEASRHEFINLFALLVRKFPSCPSFSDFVPLLDHNDPEMDFFNNLVHIQLHRRARALRKICYYLSDHRMKTDSIVHYLMPCVMCYLKDEQYAKASNVLDAAIEALGALCRVLPWPRYMLLLTQYLEKLPRAVDNQKLVVRVVVSILDNFHYDLSNCHKLGKVAPTIALPGETPKEVDGGKDQEAKEEEKDAEEEEEVVEDELKEGIDEDEEEGEAGVPSDPSQNETAESELSTPSRKHFQVCGTGLANRINKYIVHAILPKLHKILTRKSRSDDIHKKAEASKYAEDEEVLRVPISLAMVKLLQTLPAGVLEANLPNVLLKVCMFMKSRANDIRVTARDTLVKILHNLGARFFSYILKELTSLLKRGYQLHVLCYTVWALLKHMHSNSSLNPGDLDSCIPSLVQVLNEELFGQVAEEKEVAGIKGKLPEARSSKSFDSYHILALYITKSSLPKVIVPLKQELEKGHNHVTARKAGEVLRKLGTGLVDNKGIELNSLLTFVYGVTTESLPMLKQSDNKEGKRKEIDPRLQPTDTYLVKREPKRGGKKPKTHSKTNLHIIVEFGFQVLHELLKHSRLSTTDQTHLELVDPFIAPVCDSLTSKHLKVSTTALRCLVWLLKFPLPSLTTHVSSISNHVFVLLSTYAATGAARGDNFELVVMCFKTLTVLVRDVQYHSISQEQLQVLLGYVEEDIHDYTRQATAFTLLKAILSRKLVVPEVHEVIKKVQELSVSSEQPNIRLQCRQVMAQFLLDYPLGAKLKTHLEFYIVQLDYEHESGRESALEMLATVFSSFPQKVLVEHSGLFFIPLASRLVNDDSSKCRKLTSLAIKSLLVKLSSNQRDHLFNMCVSWLQESKVLMRKLAAITCGLFVEVEASGFERHLNTVLPILEHQIEPIKYQQDVSEGEEKELDQLLYNLLSVLMKIIRECGLTVKLKWSQKLTHIWESIEEHLLYPHAWVRLVAAQLFGVLFASWSAEDLVESAGKHDQEKYTQQQQQRKPEKLRKKKQNKKEGDQTGDADQNTIVTGDYLLGDLELKLHNLCGLFCKQFSESELSEELAEQIIKNLVFVAKVVKIKSKDAVDMSSHEEMADPEKKTASLKWLLKRMCKEAKNESSGTPKVTLKRKSVVKWLAAVCLDLGKDRVQGYLPLVLPLLYREYNNSSPLADLELKNLAQEVMDLLKSLVGVEVFSTYYASCQKSVMDKREGRKHKIAVEAVSNPEITAVKKMKKNLAKREAKKRKIHEKRPTYKVKRQKEAMEES